MGATTYDVDSSHVPMLSHPEVVLDAIRNAAAAVQGSAGYVAMEVVDGTLAGKKGTFVLQHSGTMSHGSQQLSVTVVPDSGTGQLAGLAGSMAIIIADGKHSYEFDYTLAETH